MERSASRLAGGLFLTLLLSASTPAASQASSGPANRPLAPGSQREFRPEAGASLEPPRGIRSFGPGAAADLAGGRGSRAARGQAEPSIEWSDSLQGGPGPASLTITRKISGTPMAGSVAAFRVSPNGTTAVFIADKDTLGLFELYSAPVNGSAPPVRISTGLVFGTGDRGVSAFQITPDSTSVVFLADPDTGSGNNEIFSVPINGSSAPVKLNGPGVAPVTGLGITRDSLRTVYFGTDTAFASGATEVYRATIGTAGSSAQISNVGQGNVQGDAVAADFSPDSARVVYAADGAADNVYQWYSVPITAAGPGSQVLISAALSSVGLAAFSPDSSRVVYTSDEAVLNRREVYSKPIAGGTRIQLNPSMAGDGVTAIAVSADGVRVAYLADQTTAGVNEVYSAQMLVAGSGTRVNAPMALPQYTDTLNISPDGTTILYVADQTVAGTYELNRVPINGSAASSTLHPLTSPNDAGYFQGSGTPVLGIRAVYPVYGSTIDLFSVPFDGRSSFIQVNDPVPAGESLQNAFLPTAGTRLLAFGSGPSAGTVIGRVFAAPIRSDLPQEQINLTAAAGARGVLGYELSSDERYGIYLQDQDASGKPELYSRELDSDADTVANAIDNCPFVANASQQAVVFGADVVALNNTTFTWGTAVDARFVRGPASGVATYTTNLTGKLIEATGYSEPGVPPLNSGWYYLFAPDCAGRSYQTTLGAQPGRDLAPLP